MKDIEERVKEIEKAEKVLEVLHLEGRKKKFMMKQTA